ncbi:hypothetical protein ACEOPL_25410 [Pseudomonas aeruginosa]|nr:hypothetical protein [Pseudomonas aeruginosa]
MGLSNPASARDPNELAITLPLVEETQHLIADEVEPIMIQASFIGIVRKQPVQKGHFILIVTSSGIEWFAGLWLAIELSMQLPMTTSTKGHPVTKLELASGVDRLPKDVVSLDSLALAAN